MDMGFCDVHVRAHCQENIAISGPQPKRALHRGVESVPGEQ